MSSNANTPLSPPQTDPSSIFDLVRLNHATELLAAAVSHFNLFDLLANEPLTFAEIGARLDLSPRSVNVLLVALRGMGLIAGPHDGKQSLTAMAREHLASSSEFCMANYVRLSKDSAGAMNMIARLTTGKPAEQSATDKGIGFIFREGIESAMDDEASARRLTLTLAGRARIVSPTLAANYPLPNAKCVLDIGGGTGLYAIGLVKANPSLCAIVWDRAQVLKVAREMLDQYGSDRIELLPGDMFADPIPKGCDVMLLSNILHDWDIPECRKLLKRCADALPPGGQVLIHDVFLNDDLDGPLNIALYSAALFSITEGRAYSAAEYRQMLREVGLTPGPITPTAVNCGVLPGTKQ